MFLHQKYTNCLEALEQALVDEKSVVNKSEADDDDQSMEFVQLRCKKDTNDTMDVGTDLVDSYNDLLKEYTELKEKLVGSCMTRGGGDSGPSLTQVGIDELQGDIY